MSSFIHSLPSFLERIMSDALEEKGSIRGKTITNLRFADDIIAFAEKRARTRGSS